MATAHMATSRLQGVSGQPTECLLHEPVISTGYVVQAQHVHPPTPFDFVLPRPKQKCAIVRSTPTLSAAIAVPCPFFNSAHNSYIRHDSLHKCLHTEYTGCGTVAETASKSNAYNRSADQCYSTLLLPQTKFIRLCLVTMRLYATQPQQCSFALSVKQRLK